MSNPAPREKNVYGSEGPGTNLLERSFVEKYPELLVDTEVTISQKCVLAAKVASSI